MEEGTFPKDPDSAMPEPKDSWENSSNILNNPSEVNPHTSNPPPIVFKSNSGNENDEKKLSSGDSSKKILKLVIGMFVVLTIILSVLTFIVPRFTEKKVKDVTLTYWGLFEDESIVRPVLDQFQEENPHIKVEYKKQELPEYLDRLLVRSANGNGPDVFRFHNTWYPTLSGLLLPLPKETIEKSQFNDNYYDVTKGDLIKRGTIYGIPLHSDTLALFINTSLFQQMSSETGSEIPIPNTWQEFIDSSVSLTKRDENGAISIAGAGIGTYDNVTHAPDIISLLFAQNGVDLANPSASQEKIADAMRFYTNFAAVENNVWDATQDSTKIAFSQGKLAMYFGYSWDLADFKKQNPNLQIKVVPVPQLISDEKINIASYWVEGISQKSKHPTESALLLKFLARSDIAEKLYVEQAKSRQIGEPYSYKSLAEKLKDTDSFIFVDQSNTAESSIFVSDTFNASYNDKYNEHIRQATNSILNGDSESSATEAMLKGFAQTTLEFSGASKK